MTDSVPENETATAPPAADGGQNGTKDRVKWTREHRLAFGANIASFASAAAATAAFALLFLTLQATRDSLTAARNAVSEAHEQAVQAKLQTDIAQKGLVAVTRARLKLITMTSGSVDRASGGGVAWFNFKPAYKNFGQAPAQDIFFHPHIFVVGAGPAPKETCEEDKRLFRDSFTEVIFPQDGGGVDWVGVQIPLQVLDAQAAEVRAVQPSATIYLGVIGCLIYKSTSGNDIYATGFVGDLRLNNGGHPKPSEYVPLYNILTEGGRSAKIGMEIRALSAWAD